MLSKPDYPILFKKERETIQQAGSVVEKSLSQHVVALSDYESLLEQHKKTVKRCSSLVRIADRIQNQLQHVNQQVEEKIKLRTQELEDTNQKLNTSLSHAQRLALQADEANRAKTQFIANMSHEIRNPLNGILGMADLLTTEDMKADQIDYLNALKASGGHLLTLLNDILDVSKIEANQVVIEQHPFCLSHIIYDIKTTCTPLALSKNLDLKFECDFDLDTELIGDPTRINQILRNLVDNAIKFTQNGSVFIEASLRHQSYQTELYCQVHDTGIGIAAEHQEHIFSNFHQIDSTMSRTQQGSGLGLSLSKEMIRLMGGDIKLESTLGEGTTVTFTIPFLTKVNQSTSKKPLGTSSFAKKKVLIVEDNPINQKLMTRLLQQFGYETKSALNGSLAVHQLSEESFNLVLMDIQMPEMNGYEATILIRDQNSPVLDHNIPIVAVTAHAMKDDLDKCLASGMNDYLTKPIDKVKLKAALEQWSLSLPNPTEPNSTELK